MNSVCVHGLFLFIYLGSHSSWRRVSPDLQLTPLHDFTSYESEEGKREREERGAVTEGSPLLHHHHGHHRHRATTTVTVSMLWCFCFLGGFASEERKEKGRGKREGDDQRVTTVTPPLQSLFGVSIFWGVLFSYLFIILVSFQGANSYVVVCLLMNYVFTSLKLTHIEISQPICKGIEP
ncbi:hypothetical protein HanHA300_Chr17g0659991 [Helianthus annuus]|nr:hypothetical protein HanHA300_Chr17g0659991 [Helianthus annuus]